MCYTNAYLCIFLRVVLAIEGMCAGDVNARFVSVIIVTIIIIISLIIVIIITNV